MTEKETIEQWQKIVDDSSRYQIEDNETFLDLCHYTGERFEEICSRILEFFLNHNGKHGFGNLWFEALCKTMHLNDIDTSLMEIQTEEYTYNADNKEKGRIDLVLKSLTSVIAIENKVNAKLYNKLKKYRDHINNTYNYITENNRHFFVLTAAHTLSKDDNENAKTNKFTVIKYDDLFKNVESSLNKYGSNGDPKYQYFMLDFMQTVKNRANMEITELDKFFARNREKIDKFQIKYKSWIKNNPTSKLQKRLKEETDGQWQLFNGWNLFINFEHRINIASNFETDNNGNPYGIFRIYITTRKKDKEECWEKYKDKIKHYFQKDFSDLDEGNRNKNNDVYYHLKPIELKGYNDNPSAYTEEIIKKLKECYDFLKEITDNIDK